MALEPILTDKTGKEIVEELRRHNSGITPAFPVKVTATRQTDDSGKLTGVTLQLDSDIADAFNAYTDGCVPVLWITDQESGSRIFVPFVSHTEAANGVLKNLTFGTFDSKNPYECGLKVEIRYMPSLPNNTQILVKLL